jgi:hypothetical protein
MRHDARFPDTGYRSSWSPLRRTGQSVCMEPTSMSPTPSRPSAAPAPTVAPAAVSATITTEVAARAHHGAASFLEYFRQSQLLAWQRWYLDIDSLLMFIQDVDDEAGKYVRPRGTSGYHRDPAAAGGTVQGTLPEFRAPVNDPFEATNVPGAQSTRPLRPKVDLSPAAAFGYLKGIKAKVRVGLDLWLDQPQSDASRAEAGFAQWVLRQAAKDCLGGSFVVKYPQLQAAYNEQQDAYYRAVRMQEREVRAAGGGDFGRWEESESGSPTRPETRAPRDRSKANLRFIVKKIKVTTKRLATVADSTLTRYFPPTAALRLSFTNWMKEPGRESLQELHEYMRHNETITSFVFESPMYQGDSFTHGSTPDADGADVPRTRQPSVVDLLGYTEANERFERHVAVRETDSGFWVARVDAVVGASAPSDTVRREVNSEERRRELAAMFDVESIFDALIDAQKVYDAFSLFMTMEVRRVSDFYKRHAAPISSSVVACVDAAKQARRQTDRQRVKFATSFSQTFSSIEALNQYRELNRVGLFSLLESMEQLWGHDVRSSAGAQMGRLNFVAKNKAGVSALQVMREMLLQWYGESYCPRGFKPLQVLSQHPQVMSVAALRDQARYAKQAVCFGTATAVLLAVTFVDYMAIVRRNLDAAPDVRNASYHFAVTAAFILMQLMFAACVRVWEVAGVNYVFLLELNVNNHWTGRELLRDVAVSAAIWAGLLYCFVRVTAAEYRVSTDDRATPFHPFAAVFGYASWISVGIPFLVNHTVNHDAARPRWFLRTLGRTLVTPLFPVAFSDFIMALVAISFSGALSQIQLIWCYWGIDEVKGTCSAALSMSIFALAAPPPLWRCAQAVRKYFEPLPHQRTVFPHLVNASKYLLGFVVSAIPFAAAVAIYHHSGNKAALRSGFDATFMTLASVNFVFRCWWDFWVDAGLSPASSLVALDLQRRERMLALFGVESAATRPLEARLTSTSGEGAADVDDELPVSPTHYRAPTDAQTAAGLIPASSQLIPQTQGHLFGLSRWPLRPRLLPDWYYVVAMVLNYSIRSLFIVSFAARNTIAADPNRLWIAFAFILLDIFRRFLTLSMRVEHEQVRNVENYKVTQAAPPPNTATTLLGGRDVARKMMPGATHRGGVKDKLSDDDTDTPPTDVIAGRGRDDSEGLLETHAWDDAVASLAEALLKKNGASDQSNEPGRGPHGGVPGVTRSIALASSSDMDRFFALLPEEEKMKLVAAAVEFVPTQRVFNGRRDEGKSRWFAARPVDVKVAVLLRHIGRDTVEEYAEKSAHPDV